MDAAAKTGATSVYVEILSKHGVRVIKAPSQQADEDHLDGLNNA